MGTSDLHIRLAERRDLPHIIGRLADDPLPLVRLGSMFPTSGH